MATIAPTLDAANGQQGGASGGGTREKGSEGGQRKLGARERFEALLRSRRSGLMRGSDGIGLGLQMKSVRVVEDPPIGALDFLLADYSNGVKADDSPPPFTPTHKVLPSVSSIASFDSTVSSSLSSLVSAFPAPPSAPAFSFPPPSVTSSVSPTPTVSPAAPPELHLRLPSLGFSSQLDSTLLPTPPLSLSGSMTPRREGSIESAGTEDSGPKTPKLGSPVRMARRSGSPTSPKSSPRKSSPRSKQKPFVSNARPVSAYFDPKRPPSMPLPPVPPSPSVPRSSSYLEPTPHRALRNAASSPLIRPSASAPSTFYPTPPESAASSFVFSLSRFPSTTPSPSNEEYELPPMLVRQSSQPRLLHTPSLAPPPPSSPRTAYLPRTSSLNAISLPPLDSPSFNFPSSPLPSLPPVSSSSLLSASSSTPTLEFNLDSELYHDRLRTLSSISTSSSDASSASSLQLDNITAALDALIERDSVPSATQDGSEAAHTGQSGERVPEKGKQKEEERERRLLRRVTSAVELVREQRALAQAVGSSLQAQYGLMDKHENEGQELEDTFDELCGGAGMARKMSLASSNGSSVGSFGSPAYGGRGEGGMGRWSLASGLSGMSPSGREEGWTTGGYRAYKLAARRPSRLFTPLPAALFTSQNPFSPYTHSRRSSASSKASLASHSSSASSASEEMFDLSFDSPAPSQVGSPDLTTRSRDPAVVSRSPSGRERERWSWVEKGLAGRRRSSATTADEQDVTAGEMSMKAASPVPHAFMQAEEEEEEADEEAKEVLASPPRAGGAEEGAESHGVDYAFGRGNTSRDPTGRGRLRGSTSSTSSNSSTSTTTSGIPTPGGSARTLYLARSTPQLRSPAALGSSPPGFIPLPSFARRPSAPSLPNPSVPPPTPPTSVSVAVTPSTPSPPRLKPLVTASSLRRPSAPFPSSPSNRMAASPPEPARPGPTLLRQPSLGTLKQPSPSRIRRPSSPTVPSTCPTTAYSPSTSPSSSGLPRPSCSPTHSRVAGPPGVPSHPGQHRRRPSLKTLTYHHSSGPAPSISRTATASPGLSASVPIGARGAGRNVRATGLPTPVPPTSAGMLAKAAAEERRDREVREQGMGGRSRLPLGLNAIGGGGRTGR
ncbi:hypothetical protein JCM11641_006476 [Rhodosporidiobolus odoratus]